MIKQVMYTIIITLFKQGVSQRQIARVSQVDRKTVKKIIDRYQQEQRQDAPIYQRDSAITPYHEQVVDLISRKLNTTRIHQGLQKLGCRIGYSAVTHYIRNHNLKQNTCIRFHTKAGEEAQVDFGDIGKQYDSSGKKRKAYVFNMRLSYSRLDYYEVVFDQTVATWIKCHMNAFKYFGGVIQTVKLDNLKAAVVSTNFYEPLFQREYKNFADHYNFWLAPCRPYQPQEKGKVESGIKYVKDSFFAGREFNNNSDMNKQLSDWLIGANSRIHGTTKRKPLDLFQQEEIFALKQLPLVEFDFSSWHQRKVAKDCHITIENNYYSVPYKQVAREVIVQLTFNLVKIYDQSNNLLASHPRSKGKGVFTTNKSHYAPGKLFYPGSQEYQNKYHELMKNMGQSCLLLLQTVQQAQPSDWHRTIRGIASLRRNYDAEMINKACARALHYGITSYSSIKKMIENNAISLPISE